MNTIQFSPIRSGSTLVYNLSINAKNRAWGGNNSNGSLDFYYKQIPQSIKPQFDEYLNEKLIQYSFLKEKYNLI